MTNQTQLPLPEFSQQMSIRDLLTDLCAEISDVENEKERLETIEYAISQLQALKP